MIDFGKKENTIENNYIEDNNVDENIGKKFHRWTIIDTADDKYIGKDNKRIRMYLCKCDCGTVRPVSFSSLNNGKSQSCGCLRLERLHPVLIERNTTHGESKTRLNRIWHKMRERCYDPNNNRYDSYGGRGICVCDEWLHDYVAFSQWAKANGYADNLSIDRIDVNGNYCPENCRWVDSVAQANNCRTNRNITFNGETHTMKEWSRITGINYAALQARLNKGWSEERALTTPVRKLTRKNK